MYLPHVEIREPAALWRGDSTPNILDAEGLAATELDDLLRQRADDQQDLPSIVVSRRSQRSVVEMAISRAGWSARRRGLLPTQGDVEREALLIEPSPYRIESLDDHDIDEVLALFDANFHAPRSRAHWDWKFDGNPYSQRNVALCRHEDGELAAHYAAYEMRWRDAHQNRTHRALQIGDVMSAEAHRGVGRAHTSLLARTVLFFDARFSEEHVAFDFGFNTGSAWKFFIRFNRGEQVEAVTEWQRSTNRPLPPSVGRCRIRRVERVDSSFDRLFARAAPSYGALVERTAEWLKWRYLECPDAPEYRIYAAHRWGRLVGWAVFRAVDDTLRWCDALTTPRRRDCMGLILEQARNDHPACERMVAWFPDRPNWWSRELDRLGFDRRAQPDGLALICAGRTEPDPVSLLGRSYYTWGDSDLA